MGISSRKFQKAIELFGDLEKFRGELYYVAKHLIEKGHDIEAYIIILSTWNFAYFRYVINSFDLSGFKSLMKSLESVFQRLEKKKFRNFDFDKTRKDIEYIYSRLSIFPGIKFTGASKIMHLKNPRLFIMWDDHIRKFYKIRSYNHSGYIEFLKKMRSEFFDVTKGRKNITKLIDEYNYVSITRINIIKQKIKEKTKKIKQGKRINREILRDLKKELKWLLDSLDKKY